MKCQFSNANSFTLTKYIYYKYLVIAGDGVYTLVFSVTLATREVLFSSSRESSTGVRSFAGSL